MKSPFEPDPPDDELFDDLDDPSQPEDYDGGYGPDSYFARAMNKDD